jgi:HEPN domain-containing protein
MSAPSPAAASIDKADNDVLNIENKLASKRIPWGTVCFHAQQAAEKLLKAFLSHHGQALQHTHDLVALLAECAAIEPSLAGQQADCQSLTYYAVGVRYPNTLFEPDEADGRAMIEAMQRVRGAVVPLIVPAGSGP